MAHLTLVLQGREVRKFVLNSARTTIGRARENDIVINNIALSRRHAEVHAKSGQFEVRDLGSQNGVYVNGQRIHEPRVLTDADSLTLGTYHFVFCAGATGDPDIHSARPASRMEVTVEALPPAAVDVFRSNDPTPLLVLKYNDVELQRFPLRGRYCQIGRSNACDIQIPERRLSRKHCQITRDGHRVLVEDLGSQNGTFVNRRKVERPQALAHGDVLNFAEYCVLFLADATTYDGPDADGSSLQIPVRASAGLEHELTEQPPVFRPPDASTPKVSSVSAERAIAPRPRNGSVAPSPPQKERLPDWAEVTGGEAEPFVQAPHLAQRRQANARVIRERVRSAVADDGRVEEVLPAPVLSTPAVAARAMPEKGKRRGRVARPHDTKEDLRDVDDVRPAERPDSNLDDWFDLRNETSALHDKEPSVLLSRAASSVSRVLSTMMVDKRELDKNLGTRAKARRFVADVRSGATKIFAGPLSQPVTILGTGEDADIRLVGRFVAGRHSLLVRVLDSLLLVRLGSSSAARVNGLPKLQAFLKAGDVIQIDETTIEISEE